MSNELDLTGQKFNRLTAIERVGVDSLHNKLWLCKCDCGETTVKPASAIKSGKVKSCGCAERDRVKVFSKKYAGIESHGMSRSRIYRIWIGIKQRCGLRPRYLNVKLCDEWQDFTPFYEWSIKNGYKDDLSIDRIDGKGDYEPSNCRWVTCLEQQNNLSNNWNMTYKGVTKSASAWARGLNRNPCCFYYWKLKGKTDEQIIERFVSKMQTNEG